MRRIGLAALALPGLMAALSVTGAAADRDVRLAGCLVRAQDGDGYLMTNVPGEAAWQQSTDGTVAPGPVGTTGTVSTVFYWLDEHEGLGEHVGHYVELEGRLDDELRDGEIRLQPKGDWTEIEVRSGGRSMTARVPRSLLVVPTSPDGARTSRLDVLVRTVEPRRVRMLAAACGR